MHSRRGSLQEEDLLETAAEMVVVEDSVGKAAKSSGPTAPMEDTKAAEVGALLVLASVSSER